MKGQYFWDKDKGKGDINETGKYLRDKDVYNSHFLESLHFYCVPYIFPIYQCSSSHHPPNMPQRKDAINTNAAYITKQNTKPYDALFPDIHVIMYITIEDRRQRKRRREGE